MNLPLLDIIVTITALIIQYSAIHYGDSPIVDDNIKLSRSVIRAALEMDEHWSLEAFAWVEFRPAKAC